DPAAQEAIVIAGVEYSRFTVDAARTRERRMVDPEFGPGLEITVTGAATDRDRLLKLERTTRVRLPDAFPHAALFETTYRNQGERSLHVDRVYSQRVLLDRHLAEPAAKSHEFASFQGGAYKWGLEYAVIRLEPDFRQSNFQGVGDVRGSEGVGGGMPFIDAWSPTMGVALTHLEKTPQWLSLPVEVRPDRRVEMSVVESPLAKFGQPEWLKPGEAFSTVLTAVLFHRLDSFDALRTYGQLLRRRGIAIPDSASTYAHEPYWKSWGWMESFTQEKIFNILPELKSMGIRVANLDMGWYDYMGDWRINRAPGKFPGGEPDMIAFVNRLHKEGFRTSFWWYPLGVSTKSRLAAEHKELLIQGEDGSYPLDNNEMLQLCPAHPAALDHLRQVLTRAVSVWGFDGAYTDYQGLSSVPACFNPAHHHRSPLDSFQAAPRLFEMIHTTLRRLKADPLHEVCICSLPHSPYNMPYYDLANASDPVSTWQVRSRVKVEKAIRGGTFPVGDCYQIPIEEWTGYSVPESFETAMGTGAQVTTFYTHLDETRKGPWKRWFQEYRELDLTHGEYLNLYDLAFDKPEGHVIRKGRDLYFGFFADVWPRDRYKIELRGLEKDGVYEVYDYANRRDLGTVKGADPRLNIAFKDSLLLRVRPVH
ncbi:MAG: alpha-galactosidase, partial [Acidobacteria bacterium]|nr:alpha-galactosidase [Acidobacteriota bacterium]